MVCCYVIVSIVVIVWGMMCLSGVIDMDKLNKKEGGLL